MLFRLLDTPPAPGAWNMAVDSALLESVRDGAAPVLRFYRWAPACLSLGRNQPARSRYDLDALLARRIEVVRRPTGGRAVLHDRELTYAVVLPADALGGQKRCYAAVNRALARGLRALGVAAELQPATGRRAAAPSLAPCFQEPAEGELVVSGRKLVGSAQRRADGVLLQHGSLLLANQQGSLREVLLEPGVDPTGAAALSEFLEPLPSWNTLTAALVEAWQAELEVAFRSAELEPGERARAEVWCRHYQDPAWTWRC
jgi:lipoyl(octanoyl) transferase